MKDRLPPCHHNSYLIVRTFFLLCLLIPILSSCNPIYVSKSAYQGAVILLKRQDIEECTLNSSLPQEKRDKLKLVLEARQFATQIGLNTGKSYTTYSEINRAAVSWVILASKKDAFEFHTWWFPIIGRVPYKGFFDRDEAVLAAGQFDKEQYDTIVRPVEAYSTLGWFNDPLLSTTLARQPVNIVELILHELTHNTIWIKDQVNFNESLATFIGNEGAVDFFRTKVEKCLRQQTNCQKEREIHLQAIAQRDKIISLSLLIVELYHNLDQLYKSNLPKGMKQKLRREIFDKSILPLRNTYPNLPILKEVNNAEIMQLSLYLKDLKLFRELFRRCRDWPSFLKEIRSIKQQFETGQIESPFDGFTAPPKYQTMGLMTDPQSTYRSLQSSARPLLSVTLKKTNSI